MTEQIVPGSKLSRLPRILQPLGIKARALLKGYQAYEAANHRSDGMMTRHNDGFSTKPAFRKSYARAVNAAGFDYEIPFRIHQALWCARSTPEGNIVELGTGRGFVMSAILADQPDRTVHLFDSFLPNRPGAEGKQDGPLSHFYASSVDEVRANFAEWPNVHFHCGDVFETLPKADVGPVSFLHIDLNHPKVESFGLTELWPRLVTGAIILWDDYAFEGHEDQYDAANEVAQKLGLSILTTPTGQGLAIKRG